MSTGTTEHSGNMQNTAQKIDVEMWVANARGMSLRDEAIEFKTSVSVLSRSGNQPRFERLSAQGMCS